MTKNTLKKYFEFPGLDGVPSIHEIDPTKKYLMVIKGTISLENLRNFSNYAQEKFPAIQAVVLLPEEVDVTFYDLTGEKWLQI